MNTIGNYLLQMSCWLAAFWLVYVLLLKRETYFTLNRWFLNSGLIVSMAMPLIPVSYKVYRTVQPLNLSIAENLPVAAVVTDVRTINYWLLAYLIGAAFFIGRLFYQHLKLYRVRKRSNSISVDSAKVYRLEKETAPFSFFNHIYVSSNMTSETELNTVVAHEKVHIVERHWADLLLLEVVRTIQWFNPFMQLYRKAIMQNHEYLADSGTLEFGVSARTYRAILANQMLEVPVVSFANSFTFRNSTNRIIMMKKDKSNPKKRLKFLLILPLMAIIVMGFAKPNYVTENSENAVASDQTMLIKGTVTDVNGEALPGASVIVKNSNYGTVANMQGEFELAAVKPTDQLVISFVGFKTVIAPAAKKMSVKMEREVVQIEVLKSVAPPPPPPPAPAVAFRSKDGKTPLVVIDGTISTVDLNTISPESIESISVLKDEAATKVYGDKGKDGVILITTKNPTPRTSPNGEVFVVVEDMPEYPGGHDALQSYIQQAVAGSKEHGKVYVSFVVDAKGHISNARIAKSDNEHLNAKALKIVNAMPDWKPGKQRGKPVKVDYSIPLEF